MGEHSNENQKKEILYCRRNRSLMCCFNILVIDHIFTSIRNEVASYGTISSNGINRYHETHSQYR